MKFFSVLSVAVLGAGVALAAFAPEHEGARNVILESHGGIGPYPDHGAPVDNGPMTKAYNPFVSVKKTTLITVASSDKGAAELTPAVHEAAAEAKITEGPTEGLTPAELRAREICLTENEGCQTGDAGSIVRTGDTGSGLTPASALTPTMEAAASTVAGGCNEAPDGQITCDTSAPAATAAVAPKKRFKPAALNIVPVVPAKKLAARNTICLTENEGCQTGDAGSIVRTGDTNTGLTPAPALTAAASTTAAASPTAAATTVAGSCNEAPDGQITCDTSAPAATAAPKPVAPKKPFKPAALNIVPIVPVIKRQGTSTLDNLNGDGGLPLITDGASAPSVPPPAKGLSPSASLVQQAQQYYNEAATMKTDTPVDKAGHDLKVEVANWDVHEAKTIQKRGGGTTTMAALNAPAGTGILMDSHPAPTPKKHKLSPSDQYIHYANVLFKAAATMKSDTPEQKSRVNQEIVAGNLLVHVAKTAKEPPFHKKHTKRADVVYGSPAAATPTL